MNTESKIKKLKSFFQKVGKRNLIIIGAVMLIGVAVCVNYVLYRNGVYDRDTDVDMDIGDINLGDVIQNDSNASNYFSQTALSRQQARDEALEVLETVAKSENALPESVQAALDNIAQIAKDIENESNIETIIEAKGFEECIAVISDGKATIIVQTDGLLASEVAQINEIVYEQSGILPTELKIIEKN
jgi:stage III sporulation protein AH